MGVKFGIYKIVRKIDSDNDKMYIGSSIDIDKRLKAHKRMLKNGTHDNIHLQRTWDKYGENVFSFEIVEIIDDASKLIEREQHFIETLKTYEPFGYNICRIPNRQTGVKWTDEQKESQSVRIKEYYSCNSSPMKGKKFSLASRKKLSESKKKLTGDKNPFFGKFHSVETKAIISQKNKGRSHSVEAKDKISKSKQGEKAPLSKLNDSDVLNIKHKIENGESLTGIAKDFNVTKQTIFYIKEGKTWTHITKGKIEPKVFVANGGNKLKVEDVVEIIKLLKEGKTCQSIADIYKVRQETINAIKLKRTWKHIPRD